jgi:Mn-dependent DtxR family transcriptional regulator
MNEPSNVAKVWLFLLEEGGCWETHAIREHVDVTPRELTTALHSMTSRGYVKRLRDQQPFLYEVDDDCTVPLGVQVRGLRKAGVGMVV